MKLPHGAKTPAAAPLASAERPAAPQGMAEASPLSEALHGSPRMAAQRQRTSAMFGNGTQPVQRLLGFEFQARKWELKDKGQSVGRTATEYLSGYKWHMEADDGEPEFVTDAIDDRALLRDAQDKLSDNAEHQKLIVRFGETYAGLVRTMFEISEAAKGLQTQVVDHGGVPDLGATTVPNRTSEANTIAMTQKSGGEAVLTADPQMTAGVAGDRLLTLFSLLVAKGKTREMLNSQGEPGGQHPKHYAQDIDVVSRSHALGAALPPKLIFAALDIDPATEKAGLVTPEHQAAVRGFVALVGQYVFKYWMNHDNPLWYMKDVPVYAKTDMGKVGQELNLVNPKPLVDYVLGELKVAPGAPLNVRRTEALPTFEAWTTTLFSGNGDTDPIAKIINNDFDPGEAVNQLDKDTMTTQVAKVIVELRRVAQSMPHTEWYSFASEAALWMRSLNDPAITDVDQQRINTRRKKEHV